MVEGVEDPELPCHGVVPLVVDALGGHIPVTDCDVGVGGSLRVGEFSGDAGPRVVAHSIFFFRRAL